MRARRSAALIGLTALLAPLAVAAMPPCAPVAHCPMAMAMADGAPAPCHDASIDADDCCPGDAAAAPVPAVPLAAASSAAVELPVAGALPGERVLVPSAGSACATPLYTLFRALLI